MPCERMPMRYGHSEGHTDVCFHHTGKWIVTCGSDGDVRIWESLDDDDPKTVNVGSKAYALALQEDRLVTAPSNNTVQMHTFPAGEPDGILTRFTTHATHLCFNADGTRLAAASDFMVKVVDVADSSQQKTLRGHEAPVLSLTFDPKDHFLASASCDGSVVVWKIEDQTQVVRWPVLQKVNDVAAAKSLCRLAWQPITGQLLAVPVETKVQLYQRDSWAHVSTLSDDLITQPINVVGWSPCGRFLAAGTLGGLLNIWDVESKLCLERQKHEKGYTVCGLAWHPAGSQLAYTDTEGCLSMLDGLSFSSSSSSSSSVAPKSTKDVAADYDDLFDGDEDGRFPDDGGSGTRSPAKHGAGGHGNDEDDDDEPLAATGRVRNRGSFLDDDNSLDSAPLRLGLDDDVHGYSMAPPPSALAPPPRPEYDGPRPTPPQKAFQPGSTPAHLSHRFMMWNSVGIVRGYDDEQDKAIDVEFHDSAVHHAMHLSNTLGHTLAALSQEAVLLACPATPELASKLQCLHFSSWDGNKEWMVDLPQGEEALGLCLGQAWAAVATDAMLLRLFTLGGLQGELFSLPGPLVAMAAHGEQLLIVYHRGTGFGGDQALGVQLFQLGRRRRQVICGEPLPLSRSASLSWLGFTAQGTPCYLDSAGVVRLLNRSLGNSWTPVCSTRDHCKSPSDHYWLVGVHESPQQLRCIPCKGARFPPTLPRPAVAVLPFKLPLCQTSTEKGQMEEQYWRSVLLQQSRSFLSSCGYEVDEEQQEQDSREQQEILMKMFALSCKVEREFRCVELAELMSGSVVPLAIRYASRSRRLGLAERLSQLALEKANQLQEEGPEEEEEERQHTRTSGPTPGERQRRRAPQEEEEEEEEEEEGAGQERQMDTQEAESRRQCLNPFAKGATAASAETPAPRPVSKEGRVNPFKVSGSTRSSGGRVSSVLDSMTTSTRKPVPLNAGGKLGPAPVLKPLAPRNKTKTQSTLLQMTSSKPANKKTEEREPAADRLKQSEAPPPVSPGENAENDKPKTGFQLYLAETRKCVCAEQPELTEVEVIREAMSRFRTLTADERLSWTERAKGASEPADAKKRKREEGEEPAGGGAEAGQGGGAESAKKKKSLDPSAKLAAFAFNHN